MEVQVVRQKRLPASVGLGYFTTKKTLKKLKKGKNYYVRVREINRAGGKTTYGKWSAVKKVKMRK